MNTSNPYDMDRASPDVLAEPFPVSNYASLTRLVTHPRRRGKPEWWK